MAVRSMVAVSITTPRGTVVKRVRRETLHIYEREGWHTVPRHRFKQAKREYERRAGR